jgi:adenylate cyclase
LAQRIVVPNRACNSCRHFRLGGEFVVEAATHVSVDSAIKQAWPSAAEYTVDCGAAVYQPERDPGQEYFSDGITDDLITDLSRVPKLFVIARTSSFTYKGRAEKAQSIGRELGVKYLLEGSVRRVGNQVRINVQLVDATTGNEVWSQRYDRQMRDIFKLQDVILQSLTTTLGLQLSMLENGIVVRQRTSNLEAYDYFLKGVEAWFLPTPYALRARATCLTRRSLPIPLMQTPMRRWAFWIGWDMRGSWMLTLVHSTVLKN